MSESPFKILYRQFVFRLVDVELLSANALGDAKKLLGQVAALLIAISLIFSIMGAATGIKGVIGWNATHLLISSAMLVSSVITVLSWDGFFPDRRDILSLSPLPVKTGTVVLAKIAAVVSVVGMLTAAFSTLPFLACSFALGPRALLASIVTLVAASALVVSSVVSLQSIAAALLPRQTFLKVSAFLQVAVFASAIAFYFLAPLITNRGVQYAWIPSYWFFGLFEMLNGSLPSVFAPLARAGTLALAIVVPLALVCYPLTYRTVIRDIIEQPDIVPSKRSPRFSFRFGDLAETAIVLFSVRTLSRSKQHRVVLALYLGLALAFILTALKAPAVSDLAATKHGTVSLPLLFATLVTVILSVLGLRLVFVLPYELRANWIFRTIPFPDRAIATVAGRRSILLLGAVPVWLACTLLVPATHSVVLGFLVAILTEICLIGFAKLPFTCSYLPGKSNFNMAFLGFAALLQLVVLQIANWERGALEKPLRFAQLIAAMAIAFAILYWRNNRSTQADDFVITFEDEGTPEVQTLNISRMR